MPTTQIEKKPVENEAQETKLAFRFYELMGYPLPQPSAFFAWRISEKGGKIAEHYSENCVENRSKKVRKKFVLPNFSWPESPSPLLSEFLVFLKKRF